MNRLLVTPLVIAIALSARAAAQETAQSDTTRRDAGAPDTTAPAVAATDSAQRAPWRVAWRVVASHLYHSHPSDPSVREPRDVDQSVVASVGDHPLYHGATYARVGANIAVVPGASVDGEIVAEHRGVSYGVYAVDEMIVFPRVLLSFDTTFTIAGEPLRAIAQAGHFSDVRWGEGLTFYNMDGQGSNIELGWRWVRIWRRQIGDALYGIGLGIGDVMDLGVGLLDVPIVDGLEADVRLSHVDYFASGGNGTSGSLALQYASLARLYLQYELRDQVQFTEPSADRSAVVIGLAGAHELGDFAFDGRAEWRRYGAGFNDGRINRDVKLRGNGSTIGEFLYPLDFYERPLSQWAVFTEFQEQDVEAMTLQIDAYYRLPYSLIIIGEIDLNAVSTSGGVSTSIDLFNIGFGWEPSPGTRLTLTSTNRAMNLDRHYPTVSAYRDPVLLMTARVELR
ncbi:MAG TPA: hypothetical protein VNA88_10835 [Candidatus Kapabacteria bacterium]|jgi:hypothetical protein|nr:hypothetical protein [Candidatus Kapabacteria bacterium]